MKQSEAPAVPNSREIARQRLAAGDALRAAIAILCPDKIERFNRAKKAYLRSSLAQHEAAKREFHDAAVDLAIVVSARTEP